MTNLIRARAKLLPAFDQGDWPRVEFYAEQVLAAAPDDVATRFMLGKAYLHHFNSNVDRAVDVLAEVCRQAPANAVYAAGYAEALAAARRFPEACAAADRALALIPTDAAVLATLGNVYLEAQAVESGATALRAAVARAPDDDRLRFRLGRALEILGDAAGAERELEACIRLNPRCWPAHLRLSMLQRQTPATQHRARLQTVLDQYHGDADAQVFLNVALAKESEDLAEYPLAFRHYTLGKAAARRMRPASTERDAAMFDALHRCFPEGETRTDEGDPSTRPIFIVGMPRSGTTLLDRMLSRHPDVCSAGELQAFPTALQRASGSSTALLSLADIGAATAHIDWRRLGGVYLEATRQAASAKPHFIDKLPHNFLYAGFIARALPQARILCLRRDPLDTCLGNFRHLFEGDSGFYDYSLDLLDTGRYFVQFDRLMAHWRKALPGRVLEVSYEALVQSTEPTLRAVLTFCRLPWSAACLAPQDNTTPVQTPNAWQVRAGVYASSIGRWRNYAEALQPLRALLADAGVLPLA